MPTAGRGDAAPAPVRRHVALHDRGPPPGERRRPDQPRRAGGAVRQRRRPDDGHPLEGHLRAPRAGHRLDRARREHPRGHRHQERVNEADVVLVIVIATALAFDFTNGFHDTANVVATSISTRAMSPRLAVLVASLLNFAGAFISREVAATVATGIVDAAQVTSLIVFAGLIGAIAWNLITWYFGLPSSSSHALIGGVVGAMIAAVGFSAVDGESLVGKVFVPAIIAPIVAFATAGLAILIAYRIVGRLRPGPVNRGYRLGQVISGSLLALAHGANDAQKTMGIITLALIAHGTVDADNFAVPTWVVVSAALAIALGTYS